jgi:2-hydroxychromene-2-carboxylate isomerase
MAPAPRFYFGVMSPYSWFAAERISQLLPEAQWQCVLAGVIFEAHGRESWGFTDRRAEGIAECEARAATYGLGEMRWPEPWPAVDLHAARALVLLERSHPDAYRAFALTLMRMAFLEGVDNSELDSVLEAGRRTGIDQDELRRALGDQDVKDRLRAINDEALGLDVFGVPTVVVANQLFWGDDRLEQAAAASGSAS